jgi:hypothetical protein
MEFTKEQAIAQAKTVFAQAQEQDFPEDDWQSISDNWDLNLWMDENGNPRATMYPVLNGSTDTSVWIEVDGIRIYECGWCYSKFETIDELQDHADYDCTEKPED